VAYVPVSQPPQPIVVTGGSVPPTAIPYAHAGQGTVYIYIEFFNFDKIESGIVFDSLFKQTCRNFLMFQVLIFIPR